MESMFTNFQIISMCITLVACFIITGVFILIYYGMKYGHLDLKKERKK